MISSPAGMIRRGVVGGTVVVALALAAACSSSGGSGGDTSAPASSNPPASTSPPVTSQAAPPSSLAPPPPLTPADTTAVAKAYETFFKGGTDPRKVEPLVQHGSDFDAALVAQAKTPEAQGLSAKVTKVDRDPTNSNPNVAIATFTLYSKGDVILKDSPGYAVEEDGTWKVAAGTVCQLLSLSPKVPVPDKCSESSFTAFPES